MWSHRRSLPLANLANSQVVGFIFCSFDGETQSPPRSQPVPAGASLTGIVAPEGGHGSPPILCYHHPSRFTLTVTEPPSLSTDPIPTLSTTRYCGAEAPPPPRDLTFQLYHRRLSPESPPNLNGTRSGWSSAWIQRLTTSFVGFRNIYTLTRPIGHHRSPLAAAGTIIAGKDSLQKLVVNNDTSVDWIYLLMGLWLLMGRIRIRPIIMYNGLRLILDICEVLRGFSKSNLLRPTWGWFSIIFAQL
ncbi:unnamed protein product [Arabis nemorensis]|uniref:Uncharacterized protein n=1 Tax=Arabis nemorensis TaxID=586526 RepID=A0A565AZ94_9BRAS|nr:unnamed protein product [Arabis nemorensis]